MGSALRVFLDRPPLARRARSECRRSKLSGGGTGWGLKTGSTTLHDPLILTMQGFGQHEPLIRLDLHRVSWFLSPTCLSHAGGAHQPAYTTSYLRHLPPKV